MAFTDMMGVGWSGREEVWRPGRLKATEEDGTLGSIRAHIRKTK